MAEKGDEWALQKLLSRPTLLPDAEPYYAAFVLLSRDRAIISIGMGAALPRPVPRDVIRREGERLDIGGTPTIYINGRRYELNLEREPLRQWVQEELDGPTQ